MTYQWRRGKFMTKRPSAVPDGWKLTKFFRKNERRQFLLSCQGFQKRRWPFLVHEMKGGWWISFLQKKIAPPVDLVKRLAPDPHRDTRLSDMIREGRLEDLGKGSWRYRAFTSD